MKVKFVTGFQGRETNNIWRDAGQVVDVEEETAEILLRDNRVTAVIDEPAPVFEPDPETPKQKRGKK
jgi:hypothetical protein